MSKTLAEAVAWLRTLDAVRQRCGQIYAAAEADKLNHFALDLSRLDATADYVIETIKANYPDLDIPYHSRWRHFAAGGRDRWGELEAKLKGIDAAEIARIRIELVIISVLLDAGAGEQWRYTESDSGQIYSRSEGLALASLALYQQGALSADENNPYRVDGEMLESMGEAVLSHTFQVNPDNPLIGINGRTSLLRRLGKAVISQPEFFGEQGRLGNLYDYFVSQAYDNSLSAADIVRTVLVGLNDIWPSRTRLDEINLGDVWHHPAATSDDLTNGLVAFHKLSQWLSYSLLEPLQDAGLEITNMDALTGLPEYRNGGLFIDLGVLQPKHGSILTGQHTVDSEVVVEWRALTVILLDKLAERIRAKLNLDSDALPLAKVLEGGSWSAGRRIARERRANGGPPLNLLIDGTVF